MKLLITTQKIDEADPILGFMCGWVRALAGAFEEVTVICLEKGSANLPSNVRVFSLGKENGGSRTGYGLKFLRLIVSERRRYDAVFVHMNPEYVILGGFFWRLFGKKVALWYNHGSGGVRLRLAMMFANVVCHTSPYAASAGTKKSRQMPVGVDTELFTDEHMSERRALPHRLLSLGRIAPIKHTDVIIDAALALLGEGARLRLTVVGDALPKDAAYMEKLLEKKSSSAFSDEIQLLPGVGDRKKVAGVFNESEFFINASPAGLFDKTVFEAMATGCIPLVSSKAFENILPPECFFKEGDSASLAEKLSGFLKVSPGRLILLGGDFREKVLAGHSLKMLAGRIRGLFNS